MRRRITSFLAIAAGAVAAHGMLIAQSDPRTVLKNVQAYIKSHPESPQAQYILGYIESSLWANGDTQIMMSQGRETELPAFFAWSTVRIGRDPERPCQTEDAAHLARAIEAYLKAGSQKDHPEYQLAVGWAMEQAMANMDVLGEAMPWPADRELSADEKKACAAALVQLESPEFAVREGGSKVLLDLMPRCAKLLQAAKPAGEESRARIVAIKKAYLCRMAVEAYRRAYADTITADSAKKEFDMMGDHCISFAAGTRLIELLDQNPTLGKKGEADEINEGLKVILKKPRNGEIIDW